MTRKAFFLDRDGVINKDPGYVGRVADFEFLPGVFEACRVITQRGYLIIVVTNQAGIARGYYTEEDFKALNLWMLEKFAAEGVDVAAVYFCPHHPEKGKSDYKVKCDCRKPEPGMLLKAIQQHQIDRYNSVMVGDKVSDIEAGRNANIGNLLGVRGNYPLDSDRCFTVHNSLKEAVEYFFSSKRPNA